MQCIRPDGDVLRAWEVFRSGLRDDEYGYHRQEQAQDVEVGPFSDGAAGEVFEIERLRRDDFANLYDPRTNTSGLVYLDHAGATLYSRSQIIATQRVLLEGHYGNPHSVGPVSSATADEVESVRLAVLKHFNGPADEWSVVFTSGTTAALKLVADSFPWLEGSCLLYPRNSHTSVLGMREVAAACGASFSCLPCTWSHDLPVAMVTALEKSLAGGPSSPHLVVLPLQCNFTGAVLKRSVLETIVHGVRDRAGAGGEATVSVLLDASKHVATSPLDLSELPEGLDMVALSFYKMFGYPTGLGALIIRTSAAERLTCGRRYFGGGTVVAVVPHTTFYQRRPDVASRLSDGTEHYLGIMAVKEGLAALAGVGGMHKIQTHTRTLSRFLYEQLSALRHANNAPVCEIYGPPSVYDRGPVVAFNLKRRTGEYVGYAEVEKLATLHSIQLRTGCFCNPGACQEALGFSEDDVKRQLEVGHVCWDDHDMVDGRPTGAIRASLGYMSTWQDVAVLLAFLRKYFVSREERRASIPTESPAQSWQPRISQIVLYPIKSCAGQVVEEWPVGPSGLLFDREWALVDAAGQALRMKRAPAMCMIKPVVKLDTQELVITAQKMPEPLRLPLSYVPAPAHGRSVSVCGEACEGIAYDAPSVAAWFTACVGIPCSLVRSSPHAAARRQARRAGSTSGRATEKEGEPAGKAVDRPIAFSNEAQFLLVCAASVEHLNSLIASQVKSDYQFRYEGTPSGTFVTIENFRPNFVVHGGVAHQEDHWRSIEVGTGEATMRLRVTGPCSRCSMVNIDHKDGSSAVPVLRTLASYRRDKASIYFGQFVALDGVGPLHDGWVRVGQEIRVSEQNSSENTEPCTP